MARITLKEYACRLGKDPVVARNRAWRGVFKTAYKFGRDWTIDEDEPWVDGRVKSGKYTDWRKKLEHDVDSSLFNGQGNKRPVVE